MKKHLLLAAFLPLLSMSIFAQGGWGHNSGNNNGPGAWTQTPEIGMPQVRFEQLRRDMGMRRFDNGKMVLAKQAAVNNRMSSRQVRLLTEMFSFESNRVEFAKFAYNYVVDPDRYSLVNAAFAYPSSVAALNQYIAGGTIVYTGGAGGSWGGNDGPGNGYGNGHGHGHGHGHNCGAGCAPAPVILPIAHCDFSRLLLDIQGKCFESTKEEVAMGALRHHYFTADQIRSILFAFTFESTKLDFAKAAYGRCVDPQNYFVLNDAFTFESSVCELTRFTGGR